MDISSAKTIKKCDAGIGNPNCTPYSKLKGLSASVIEKINSLGYKHQLNEGMRICDSCRLVIVYKRSPKLKKRRTGVKTSSEDEDPRPSTSVLKSGQQFAESQHSANIQESKELLGKHNYYFLTTSFA